jgi:solute:Na+ symporter, SSS family
VQSTANNPADGGGFMMQRLAATRSASDARRAAGLFVVLNYLLRPWPWFLVALAALVLIPMGQEEQVLGGKMAEVAANREAAYPALIAQLLPEGLKGMLIASLMAAFMSTVDTHINWGASYLANDLYRAARPAASERELLRASRSAVVLLAFVAILSAMYIGTIEGAWRALASIGAGLAAPTALRWVWWRVNASAELFAILAGLGAWFLTGMAGDSLPYELRLIVIGATGALVCVVSALLAPATEPAKIEAFVERVQPVGNWPGRDREVRRRAFWHRALAFALLLCSVYGVLFATRELFFGGAWSMLVLSAGALAAGIAGWNVLERSVRHESNHAIGVEQRAIGIGVEP